MANNEQFGFVFAVTFILIFSAILISIPADLEGQGQTAVEMSTIDPNIISGFSDSEVYNGSVFTPLLGIEFYDYTLNSLDWRAVVNPTDDYFAVGAKVYFAGVFWFGQIDYVNFISDAETNREYTLTFAEIDADAEGGVARYSTQFESSGNSAGTFIFYWNETLYANSVDAWDNDALSIIHGVGIDDTAGINIVSLLISLLFLQLPDCPILINIIIATPIWACVIYLVWWFIISMIPFLGGA